MTAEVDGQLVALDVDQGVCYGLNHVGTRIWSLIERPRSLSDICDVLVREFNVERDVCEADVGALADALSTAKLAQLT